METYKLKFPRIMLVADSENELNSNPKQRVVIAYKQNTYITWQRATTFEEAEKEIGTMVWSYGKDLSITDVKVVNHAMSDEECREDYMKKSFKKAGFSDGLSENLLSYFRTGTKVHDNKSIAKSDPNNYMVKSTTESLKQMFNEAFEAGMVKSTTESLKQMFESAYEAGSESTHSFEHGNIGAAKQLSFENWYEANRDNINNAILQTGMKHCDPFTLAQDQLLTDKLQFVGSQIDVTDSDYVDFVCKSPEYSLIGTIHGEFLGSRNYDDSKVSEFEKLPIDWIELISNDEGIAIFRITLKTRIYKQLGMAVKKRPDSDATISCEVVKKLI